MNKSDPVINSNIVSNADMHHGNQLWNMGEECAMDFIQD